MYQTKGYTQQQAQAKTCQDIILYKIANSNLSSKITLKGGIVLFNISKNIRRTTNDIDLDFIRYSIDDKSICLFINNLNSVDDDFHLKIIGKIISLHHESYHGKRVGLIVRDKYKNEIKTKIDIGVNDNIDVKQKECIFEIGAYDCSVKLLINTPEQIFTEKIKSLMIHGIKSTRYKDIYDLFFLMNTMKLSKESLKRYFNLMIFEDKNISINSIDGLIEYYKEIVYDELFKNKLSNPKVKWIELEIDEVLKRICDYLNKLK